MAWELALPLTAAGSGAAWAHLAARRAGFPRRAFAVRSLLGGAAAFGLAFGMYDLAEAAGLPLSWDRVLRADAVSVALACVIGLLEEGAKLAGILLVVDHAFRRRTVLAATVGVAAGFASLEALVAFGRELSAVAFARAALGPVAHTLLAAPLAFGVVVGMRRRNPRRLLLAASLIASAALHAAGDLSLALPSVGRVGYALTLAVPAIAVFAARARGARKMKGPLSSRTLTRTGGDHSSVYRREAGIASERSVLTSAGSVNPGR